MTVKKKVVWPIQRIMKMRAAKPNVKTKEPLMEEGNEQKKVDEEDDLWKKFAAIEEEWDSKVGNGQVKQEEKELIKVEEDNDNEVESEFILKGNDIDKLVMGEEEFEVQEDKEETSRSQYFVSNFSLNYVCTGHEGQGKLYDDMMEF